MIRARHSGWLLLMVFWSRLVAAYPVVPDSPSVSNAWFEPAPAGAVTRFTWQSDPVSLDALAFLARSLVYDAGHLQCDLELNSTQSAPIVPYRFNSKSCSALPIRCPRFTHQVNLGNNQTAADLALGSNAARISAFFSSFNYCGMGAASGSEPSTFAIWALLGYLPSNVFSTEAFQNSFSELLKSTKNIAYENSSSVEAHPRAYAVDSYVVLPKVLRRQAMGTLKQYLSDGLSKMGATNGACAAYSSSSTSGNQSRVESVHDAVEPAYYYDCAYQKDLGDKTSFVARDAGTPAYRNFSPSEPSDTIDAQIRKEAVEVARRFSCVDRPYHPDLNPESPGVIFFTQANCTGDPLIYVPFEVETNTLADPGPAFYRIRQPNAGTWQRPNMPPTTAVPPVYETDRFRQLTPTEAQAWTAALDPSQLSAQFPVVPSAQLGDQNEFAARVGKLEAFAHFLEILDRKIYSISRAGSNLGVQTSRQAFRRTVRFKYRNATEMGSAPFPGGIKGPFEPYFDDGNCLPTSTGFCAVAVRQPVSYLEETTGGNGSVCNPVSISDTSLHSIYVPGAGQPARRRGRFYYADQLPSDARRFAGRIVRQFRDVSILGSSEQDKKFSKVEGYEGWSSALQREQSGQNPTQNWTGYERALTFPVVRGSARSSAFPPIWLTGPGSTISPQSICSTGQGPTRMIQASACGATLNLPGAPDKVAAMACPLVSTVSSSVTFVNRALTALDENNIRRAILMGDQLLVSSVDPPANPTDAKAWIQLFSDANGNNPILSPPKTPVAGGGNYATVALALDQAKVDCDQSNAICSCSAKFKSDVNISSNWVIKCVPPSSASACRFRPTPELVEDDITVHEQWREDSLPDESGLLRGLFCERGETLFALGRNRSNFGGVPQRQASMATGTYPVTGYPLPVLGPNGDDRPDGEACMRYLIPGVVSTNPARQSGPVQNPIPALEAMGDGIAGGSMVCTLDPLVMRKVQDFISNPSATQRLPLLSTNYVGARSNLEPWMMTDVPTPGNWTSGTYSRPNPLQVPIAKAINDASNHILPFSTLPHQLGLSLGFLDPFGSTTFPAVLDPATGPENEYFFAGQTSGVNQFTSPTIPVNYGRCVRMKGLSQHPGAPLGPYAFPLRNYLLEVLQLNLTDDVGGLPNPARCTNVPWRPVGTRGTAREQFQLR